MTWETYQTIGTATIRHKQPRATIVSIEVLAPIFHVTTTARYFVGIILADGHVVCVGHAVDQRTDGELDLGSGC